MIAGLSLGSDNKRYFRGQLPRLAIITIIFMPLLYGAMYLYAFWNPFGEVNKIPTAIVNLDKGASEKGKPLHAGDEVTKSLIESGQLDLKEVSADEAAAGLADGTYYFTITIPEDFSKAIVSPSGSDPFKSKLKFTFNDANSYLATVIGQDASEQVINKINTEIGAKAVDQVLVMIESSGAQLQKAVTGAGELSNGLLKAKTGTAKLATGSVKLNDGVGKAKSGTEQLVSGSRELRTKLDAVIVPALRELDSGDLATVNKEVTTALEQADYLVAQIGAIAAGPTFQAIDRAVDYLKNSDDPIARDIGNDLASAGAAMRRDLSEANQVMNKLASDLRSLEQKLKVSGKGDLEQQLAAIEQKIASDLNELKAGLLKLDNGTNELNNGMTKLQSGTEQLVSGTSELQTGTVKLSAGAQELQAGLEKGLEQVPTWSKEQREKTADTLSTPVNLLQDLQNEAPTFGTGFAPFFCSLALFVGSILCWMLLTPLQPRPVVNGLGAYRTALYSYIPALVVGTLQACVLFVVIKFGLGLKTSHVLGMLPFMILMSATFLAIIQAFNAIFDKAIGRVVTLAFLMFALISSGGIYPVPTTALPFQIIHPLDPMTYTVNGLRQLTVAGEIDHRLPVAIAVLVGIILVSLTATALCARRNRQYTMERLYPSIEV